MVDLGLNRTKMELKANSDTTYSTRQRRLNRTKMELKDVRAERSGAQDVGLNRTKMELKVCGLNIGG